ATSLDAAATITDSDSFDFNTGQLTVTITSGAASGDVLSITNQGTSAGQTGVSGSNVTYGGTTIGTWTGGSGATALTITFNASSSPAAAQALARAITFFSSADATTSRSVQFAITDGDGGSASASKNISITLVDDAPVVVLPGGAVNYTELDPPAILDAGATVTDADSADFAGGQMQAGFASNGTTDDILEISSSGLISVAGANVSYNGTQIGTYSGGSGGTALIVSLNASSNAANVQELTRHITYRNGSQAPSTLQRTIEVLVNDGDGATSTAATKLVNVTGISNAPVLTLSGNAVSYTEGGSAAVLDPAASVSDVDSSDFDTGSLVVDITANGQSSDLLSVRNQGTGGGQIGLSGSAVTYEGGQIGTLSGGSGATALTIALNSSANVVSTQALARNITFSNSGDAPGTSRAIRFVLNDGDGGSSSAQILNLGITSTNDAPSLSLGNPSPSYVENGAPIVIAPAATVTDPDQPSDFSGGTVTADFSENGSVDDRLAVQNTGTGAGEVGVSGANVTYSGVVVATTTGGSGTTPLVITFNASSSMTAVQAVVRNITYSNVSDAPSVSGRTIRFVVADGQGGTSPAGVTALTFTAANDAPVVTLPGGALTYTASDAATVIDSGATVTDADSTDLASGTLTVSLTNATTDDRLEIRNQGLSAGQIGTSGSNVTYGGTTIGTYSGGSGTAALVIAFNPASSPAAAQALAQNVTFRNVSSNPSTVARVVSFVIDDGDGGVSPAATKTINISCPVTTHYGIASTSPVLVNASTQITVSALTAANIVSACYAGTVHFTSSDAGATLPANYTFTNGEGSHSFNFTMVTPGTQTITAVDTVTGSITGTFDVTVQASTSTALVSSATSSPQGQTVTFTATVTSPASGTISGNVTFKDGATDLGSVAVSNGTAGYSTNALSVGSHSITAEYEGNAYFLTSTSPAVTQTVTTTGAPASISATAASTTSVLVSWPAVSGAATYDIYRSELNGGFAPVATTSSTSFLNSGLIANRTYLYKVKVTGGSSFSAVDVATTIIFTTPSITASSTIVHAVDITELRTAVNAMREAAGLGTVSFTDSSLAGATIKAVHLTELRNALDAARLAIGVPTMSYTDPTITATATTMKAAHITELRAGVQ
ncbi:MAG TPA: Ig-like domain repeat protein, partial [Thermoanaerobaculia bacterium]|nr:Ig-like domain repeat protein [Thermoanaerobaculia bacterium]